jgi:hypothetical protein
METQNGSLNKSMDPSSAQTKKPISKKFATLAARNAL